MDNQTALNMLSQLEEFFFYRKSSQDNPRYSQEMTAMHQDLRSVLERFHKLTGLSLSKGEQ